MGIVKSLRQVFSKSYYLLFRVYFVLGVSSISYIALYFFIIPETTFYTPLNFVFSTECDSERCDFPKAKIPLDHSSSSQLTLKNGEKYEFILDMELPECQSNFDVGMFVISLSVENEVVPHPLQVTSEKKSSMMRYKSPLIRYMTSIIYFPLISLELYDQSQFLRMSFLSNYEQKPDHYMRKVVVTLESTKLHFYNAHLRINVKLDGFRYFMCYYPITSFLIGTPLFLCPVTAFLIFCNSYNRFTSTKNSRKNASIRKDLLIDLENEENEASCKSMKSNEGEEGPIKAAVESSPSTRKREPSKELEVETLSSFS